MKKIGLFYGPLGGGVEKIALKIAGRLGNDQLDMVPVVSAGTEDLKKYENIIFGISTIGSHTWEMETPSKEWDMFLPVLEKANLEGKVIALYGLGDHITYADHFVDSLGILGKKLLKKNALIVGRCTTDNYEFNHSEAIIDGKFIGLPLDEDFEADKTDERLGNWLDGILPELKK